MPIGGLESVTYREILEGAADLHGQSLQTLSVVAMDRYRRRVQRHLMFAWTFEFWPDLVEYSLRRYADDYDAAETVATDDVRYYDSAYWQALQASTGQTPAEDAYWTAYTPDPKLIAWTSGASTIGIPRNVWKNDPRKKNEDGNVHYAYRIDSAGLNVTAQNAPHQVYVEHIPPVPKLTGDDWNEASTYALADRVYHDSTGDFWIALQASTNQEPATGSAYWERVEIPPKFQEYLERRTFADLLDNDKQGAKAERERTQAMVDLFRQVQIKEGMAGQASDIRRFT